MLTPGQSRRSCAASLLARPAFDRWLLQAIVIVATTVLSALGITAANVAPYLYDGPTISRVDVYPPRSAVGVVQQFGDVREVAASAFVAAVRASAPSSAAAFVYDAPTVSRVDVREIRTVQASPSLISDAWEGSASPPFEGRSTSTTSSTRNHATEAAGEAAGAVTRPAGVADDFVSEVANNGKGTVWRAPGSTGNAGTVRIMEPTAQYPDGYVRF